MKIKQLEIRKFRGLEDMTLTFDDHTVVIGPNGSGKTTIIDALGLVLGRDRLIRDLTEHDFFGCDPEPTDRVDIVVTFTGFEGNDVNRHPSWFREGRGVPKWWNGESQSVQAVHQGDADELCLQLAYSGRFDRDTLTVESRRYFYDDATIQDAFDEEGITDIPFRLLKEIGFFLVPSQRTWERLASFESELFRRVVRTFGGLPAEELLEERDRLRDPHKPLETQAGLADIISRINTELSHLLPGRPEFQLRVTSTDSESLLRSITPHYLEADGYPLPAGRHGTGLLSLQTLVLLLEFGRARRNNGDNFILAVEEPELHFPPAIQRRAIYRTQSIGTQTICTSHSPHVAAFYEPTQIRVLDGLSGKSVPNPLLGKPLDADTPNSIRKLLIDHRYQVVDALMHSRLLVPEGRIECEFLRLLSSATEQSEGWTLTGGGDSPAFGTAVGLIPTHDASVCPTFERLRQVRSGIAVLVDGDGAGNRHVTELLNVTPPPEVIIQWPDGWMIEDVVVWIVEGDSTLDGKLRSVLPVEFASLEELRDALKLKSSSGGLKTNYLAYQDIVGEIRASEPAMRRTKTVLDDLRCACFCDVSPAQLSKDSRTTNTTTVIRWQP